MKFQRVVLVKPDTIEEQAEMGHILGKFSYYPAPRGLNNTNTYCIPVENEDDLAALRTHASIPPGQLSFPDA